MKEEIKDLIEKKRDAHYDARDNAVSDHEQAYHRGAADSLHMLLVEISDMEEE